MDVSAAKDPVEATPHDYANLFEATPLGRQVFEHLTRRFARPPVYEGGIDGIRKSDFRAGANSVIQFIVAQLNRNNGLFEAEDNNP